MRERGVRRAVFLSSLSPSLSFSLTGVICVENRDQMMPVAETAHCCGVEMVSGGRLKERGGGDESVGWDAWKSAGTALSPASSLLLSFSPSPSLEVRDVGGRDAPLEGRRLGEVSRGVGRVVCERVALQAAGGRGSRARTSPCPPPFSLSSPPPSHPEVDRLRPGRVVPKGAQTAGQSGGGLGGHEGLEAAARRTETGRKGRGAVRARAGLRGRVRGSVSRQFDRARLASS